MMNDRIARRKALIVTSMARIKTVLSDLGETREALEQVQVILVAMTKEKDLFGDDEFPTPKPNERAKIYLLSDDPNGENCLYLISALPLGPSPVHNHGTWAVIAGLEGEEENTIYKRLNEGGEDGAARLEIDRKLVLRDGDAVSFLGGDIHHIHVVSDAPTRHFHLYGKGFDQQERMEFSLKTGATKPVTGSFLPVDDSRRIL